MRINPAWTSIENGKQDGLLLRSSQLFAENPPVERVDELELGEVGGDERRLDALHDCCGPEELASGT